MNAHPASWATKAGSRVPGRTCNGHEDGDKPRSGVKQGSLEGEAEPFMNNAG